MSFIREVQTKYGGCVCRRCLNRELASALESRDCRYGYPFPAPCPACGKQRNIVTGLRFTGRLKLLGLRPKKTSKHAVRR